MFCSVFFHDVSFVYFWHTRDEEKSNFLFHFFTLHASGFSILFSGIIFSWIRRSKKLKNSDNDGAATERQIRQPTRWLRVVVMCDGGAMLPLLLSCSIRVCARLSEKCSVRKLQQQEAFLFGEWRNVYGRVQDSEPVCMRIQCCVL